MGANNEPYSFIKDNDFELYKFIFFNTENLLLLAKPNELV